LHLVDAQGRWRCAVVVADSVAQGIADFAAREEVDLIAMYTHDRKGLAKLIRGNITEKVQRRALMEVQVFKAEELVVS
jgi:nucleotide-binding universal stress UspA family protein